MYIKQIIKESMERNPVGLKEAVEAELISRIQLALEAKKTCMEDDLDEAVAKIACLKCDEVSTAAAWKKKGGFCPKCKVSNQGVAEETDLQEKTIKNLGGGIKASVDSDKSLVVADSSAPGGRQMVVLEPEEVTKMISLVNARRPVKAVNLGSGIICTIEADGGVIVVDKSAPGGKQMVVLEPKQIKELVSLMKEDLDESAQDTWRVSISGLGGATVKGLNRNQAIDRALSKMKISKSERRMYISGKDKDKVKAEKV